jgi:drug/metabolite transporter (DMT)-like permease
MIAIFGGLGAAFLWAGANLTSSRAGRLIGASSTVAWMMLVGVFIAGPLALLSGPVPPITTELAFWVAGSSLGGVIGLLLVYRGLRFGKVGVVTALASTEGAIAAMIAVIAGEHLTLPVVVMLCVIVAGIAIVAFATGDTTEVVAPGAERRAVLYGATAALAFGVTVYSTAKLGQSMPPLMAVLPVRILGVVGVFIPLALTGRLRLTRPAVPMVVFIGAAEVFGNASYVLGSRQSIAIAAVLASQFAAIGAIAAFFLFRERLSVGQRSGVVAIALGVAMLTAVRA